MLPANSKKAGVISCFWCRFYDPKCAGKLVEELAIVETTQWTVRVGLECGGVYCVWLCKCVLRMAVQVCTACGCAGVYCLWLCRCVLRVAVQVCTAYGCAGVYCVWLCRCVLRVAVHVCTACGCVGVYCVLCRCLLRVAV